MCCMEMTHGKQQRPMLLVAMQSQGLLVTMCVEGGANYTPHVGVYDDNLHFLEL